MHSRNPEYFHLIDLYTMMTTLPSSVTDYPCTDCLPPRGKFASINPNNKISSTWNLPATSRLIVPTTDSISGVTVDNMPYASNIPKYANCYDKLSSNPRDEPYNILSSEENPNYPNITHCEEVENNVGDNDHTSGAKQLSNSSTGMFVIKGNSTISSERIVSKHSVRALWHIKIIITHRL
nr:unnamed protein product [Callosobruchus chinensis]